jgi:outer membrane protein assembly factor BamB
MEIAPYQVHAGVQLNEILHVVLTNEILYVLLRDGMIFALNAEQGTLLWKCETRLAVDDEFVGTLGIVTQCDLLYQTDGNRLYALHLRSVQQHWEHCIDAEQCFLSHTLSGNTIYACADYDPSGTFIYAIDAHFGKRLWRSSLLPDPIFEAPLVVGEHLYCVGAQTIYALSVQSGQLLWSFPVDCTDFRSPVAIGDLLFLCVRCQDEVDAPYGVLLALQRRDGSLKWYRTFPHDPCIQSCWSEQVCVSDVALTKIYALDAVHGNLLWRLNTSCIGDDLIPGFGASLILC